MAGYNRIIMIGNLTRDPEYKQLPSGQGVCQLGLASNRQYRNKQTGSMVQEVCFVDVDVFGPQADSCNQYLQKGRAVLVEGRLKFDTWESPEGQRRSKHIIVADRVVFLSTNASDDQATERTSTSNASNELEKEFFSAAQSSPNDSKPEKSSTEEEKKVMPEQENNQKLDQADSQDSGELAFKDEPPFQDDLPF